MFYYDEDLVNQWLCEISKVDFNINVDHDRDQL